MTSELLRQLPPGMMHSKTITLPVAVAAKLVYEFAANPQNLPQWSPSFCQSVAHNDGEWIVESTSLGPAAVTFVQSNTFGVLDHIVRMSSALEVYNAMRVIPNGSGSEVMFTLFQTSGMTDEQFSDDTAQVESDLRMLKQVVETMHAPEVPRQMNIQA